MIWHLDLAPPPCVERVPERDPAKQAVGSPAKWSRRRDQPTLRKGMGCSPWWWREGAVGGLDLDRGDTSAEFLLLNRHSVAAIRAVRHELLGPIPAATPAFT